MKAAIIVDGDKERDKFNMYWRAGKMDTFIKEFVEYLKDCNNKALPNAHMYTQKAKFLLHKNKIEGYWG